MGNKIILVDGYCATGKSTFSNKLAEELKIPCFNKDTLKEVLGQGFGPESGEVYHFPLSGSPLISQALSL